MSVGRMLRTVWKARLHVKITCPDEGGEPIPAKRAVEAPAPSASVCVLEDDKDPRDPAATPAGREVRKLYAQSPNAAMRLARLELGPDAVLVESRRAPQELAHLGRYEVLFGVGPDAADLQPAGPTTDDFSRILGECMKRSTSGAQRDNDADTSFARSAERPTTIPEPAGVEHRAPRSLRDSVGLEKMKLLSRLTERGMPIRLTRDLLGEAEQNVRVNGSAGKDRMAAWTDSLREVLGRRVNVDAGFAKGTGRKTALLVGPPGAGKTTAALKLAMLALRESGRSVRLAGFEAAGSAASPLASAAGFLGIPFASVGTLAELDAAMRSASGLLIADGPFLPSRDLAALEPLSSFLEGRDDVEVHLVLPATMPLTDIARLVDDFEVLQPTHLLFTMLDLADDRIVILHEAVRTSKPLSFFSFGQPVTSQLTPAGPASVIDAAVVEAADAAAEQGHVAVR